MIRPIRRDDDAAVAAIIRDVMTEFFCNREGFAIHDAEVQAMSQAYPGGRAQFYVVESLGEALGCGGFGPLAGAPPDEQICELRKMYFRTALRGRGLGERLLRLLIAQMREQGYRTCYLETTGQMHKARVLYERLGFVAIGGPLGKTGHSACDRFYVRDLAAVLPT